MNELSLLVNCYFDDDIVVNLRVNAFNSRPSIVNSNQLTPNLFLYANEVIEFYKVFDEFIVFLAGFQDIVFYLSWFLDLGDIADSDIFL